MKLSVLAVPLAFSFLSTFANGVSVSYDTAYDKPDASLSTVACSDGSHGLLTRGFTTFGSLPKYPYIGGANTIAGWNSPNCGTCYQLTFTDASGTKKSVNVLAIDKATGSTFNIALAAMDELTGGHAVELGVAQVATKKLNASTYRL